jgi:hypothetical protein
VHTQDLTGVTMSDFELTPNYNAGKKVARVYQKVFLKYHGRRGRYIGNITRAYAQVSSADIQAGIDWYNVAQLTAQSIHPNALIGAGVLAAMSPRTDWKHNKLYAERVCQHALSGSEYPPPCGTYDRLNKAWTIAHLENPTVAQILAILNGPKTQRFFLNISGNHKAVTIDIWSKRVATAGKDDSAPKAGHDYDTLEQAFQIVAGRIGMSPRDLQAALWIHVRGTAE